MHVEQETISDHVTQVREQLGHTKALKESKAGLQAHTTHPVPALESVTPPPRAPTCRPNPAARAKRLNIAEMMFAHGLGHGARMLIVTRAMATRILWRLIPLCMLNILTRKGNWVAEMNMQLHTSCMTVPSLVKRRGTAGGATREITPMSGQKLQGMAEKQETAMLYE